MDFLQLLIWGKEGFVFLTSRRLRSKNQVYVRIYIYDICTYVILFRYMSHLIGGRRVKSDLFCLLQTPTNPFPHTPTPHSLHPIPHTLIFHRTSLTTHHSPLITHLSSLTPKHSALIPHPHTSPSSLITYPSSLTPYHCPLIPHHSSLTPYHSPFIPRSSLDT